MSKRLIGRLNPFRWNGRTSLPNRLSADAELGTTRSTRVFSDAEAGQIGGDTYLEGLSAVERGDLGQAARCFSRAAQHRPQVGWFAYRLAGILAAMGCHDEADRIFTEDHLLQVTPDLVTRTRILLVGQKHFAALDDATRQPHASQIDEHLPRNAQAVLLFLTCDATYFKLYAGAAIASALANSAVDLACHIHIVNPESSAIDEQTRILLRNPGGSVSFSSERTELSSRSETERRVYYACRRFQLLPAILRRAIGPVIIADVDQLVVRGLGPLLKAVRDADVGIIQFGGAAVSNPLSIISASAVVAGASAGARRYFDLVAAYVDYCFERDLWAWHLDQAALYGVKLMVESRDEPVRIRPLDPAILESPVFDAAATGEPAPSTVFWSITHSLSSNAAKRRLDLFARYSSR